MTPFQLVTKISTFDTFSEFATTFNLNEHDLIITQSFIIKPFMHDLNLPCHFIMQDHYGTGEPSDEMVNHIISDLQHIDYDRIIGIGGGTVIDIAKILALKDVTNSTLAFERKIPIVKGSQLILIPTTCGTGSEVTNIAIAEIKSKAIKMGLDDDTLFADHAVLIPELLNELPFKPFVHSAIDALIHAMESYLSPKANAFTKLFSTKAIEMILSVFNGIVTEGEGYRFKHHKKLLIASNFAGIAFGNAGVGAVHALSYPLGGKYHVPHGEANYQFLTEVFKLYNKKSPKGAIKKLNALLSKSLYLEYDAKDVNPRLIYQNLDDLLSKMTKKTKLRHYGMEPDEIDVFTEIVIQTQQRLLANTYVTLTVDEIRGIYQSLY